MPFSQRLYALTRRLALAVRSPREFAVRVRTLLEIRVDSLTRRPPDPSGWMDAAAFMRAEGLDVHRPPAAFVNDINARLERLAADPPFRIAHNADPVLAEVCYAVCRACRPDVVVETGVALGVTTAYTLQALHDNGAGHLHSIDFAPFGPRAAAAVGAAVPNPLRDRWTLHRGAARDVMPALLPELAAVDVFVHDSLHTAHNIRRELDLVRPFLRAPSVVIADDVQDNRSFERFARREAGRHAVIREAGKDAALGVAFVV